MDEEILDQGEVIDTGWLIFFYGTTKGTESTEEEEEEDARSCSAYRGSFSDEGFRESGNFLADDEAQGG